MLDPRKFLMGLKTLKMNYLNWNFDINNQMLIEVWYNKFSHLDNDTFKMLIEKYTSESVYAPNSPADILKYILSYDSVEEAWTKISNIIVRSMNNQMFHNIMAKEERVLYQFTIDWNIDNVDKDSFGNKCISYVYGKPFKRKYQNFLDSIKLKNINNMQIELKPNSLMIENNGGINKNE